MPTKPKRNSEKERSQDIGNPYRMKPNLTDKRSTDPFAMGPSSPRNWYGKGEPPAPAPAEGEYHYDSGCMTD
jgi:hypothetical protein